MHIPDNYLSPSTCAVMGAAIIPVWAYSMSKIKKEIPAKKIPLLGISAAFTFLVMMLNIPLPGGTSGHAVGAVLIALMLGPFSACITVSISLLIQALLFGDGGILAFGANCFNMAFILPFSGFFIFKLITTIFKSEGSRYTAAFFSGYIALNLAAFFTSFEFGIQPILFKDQAGLPIYAPYPLSISIPAMMIPHLLIVGLAEGIITAGVFAFISKASPGILDSEKEKTTITPLYAILFLLILLVPLGLISTQTAWGEWGIDELGNMLKNLPQGIKNGFDFKAIMPDYSIPSIKNEIAGYIISAIAGTAILLIIFKFISEFLKNKNEE